jgi:S1-C subfamily serine protease
MHHKIALLVVACFTTCCFSLPRSVVPLVKDISSETVALTIVDQDGDTGPFCSGVWVSAHTILTAGHCTKVEALDENNTAGTAITYIVQNEVTGHFTTPKASHTAIVVKHDNVHDLALLYTSDPPPHKYAILADSTPATGEPLHLVGQDRGLYWTYMPGIAGREWLNFYNMETQGPFLQVIAPVAGGMSGSGAFDEAGGLVGICSFTMGAPSVAFYIHLKSVRSFLR